MYKRISLWFLVVVVLMMGAGTAIAEDQDDYRELGIEMKGGMTAQEAAAKAQGKIEKYNNVKQEIMDKFRDFNPKQMFADMSQWIKKNGNEMLEWVKKKMPAR